MSATNATIAASGQLPISTNRRDETMRLNPSIMPCVDLTDFMSAEQRAALPVSSGDVPFFNQDGSPNYFGHVRLDSKEKAEAYGFGFLYDEPDPKLTEYFCKALRAIHSDREARVARLLMVCEGQQEK